ncbi:hypothetical protein [Cognatishimia activa]|uniref:Flagellar hook-length control protein FliK n=1 Tax=Cognatishimia activa TaxID=1715691 RepID=A0A0P1IR11_9RHOB|nr:hypothetical protein [Cognatishimia activa]CUI95670.1 hypothetical protein TA5113_01881 [Cognatishimia activa]CUK25892.1 hypothetical protein TA5114_01696 [Cognatishimia activa]
MNPLLTLMNGGAANNSGAPEGRAARGFSQVLANLLPDSADVPTTDANLDPKISPILKELADVLGMLQEAAAGQDLSPELAEELQEGVAALSSLQEQLQAVVAAKTGFAPFAVVNAGEGTEIFQPAVIGSDPRASVQGLPGLLQAIQSTAQSFLKGLAPVVETQGNTQLDVLAALQSKVQSLGQTIGGLGAPALAGRNPVSLAMSLNEAAVQTGEFVRENIEIPVQSNAGAGGATNPISAAAFGQPVSSGQFDLPKEFVPIALHDSVGLGPNTTDLTETNRQTATQQLLKPDVPQAKFGQAVVNQMRSVDFQDGITKVALSPRGLGTIELEMKTNSDGSLSVVVRADNAHVLSSLRDERDLLGQIIGHSGEASLDFQEFTSDQDHSFDGQGDGAFAGYGSDDSGDAGGVDAVLVDQSTSVGTIGNGQLDLMT